MRNRSPANSEASSPPVPARISRMTLRSSIASLGRSARRICCSSASRLASQLRASPRSPSRASRRRSRDRRCSASRSASSARDRAIGLDRLDHRRELGEFARQLDVGVGRDSCRASSASTSGMAGEQRVEFAFRAARSQSCRPSASAKASSSVDGPTTLPHRLVEQLAEHHAPRPCAGRARAASP